MPIIKIELCLIIIYIVASVVFWLSYAYVDNQSSVFWNVYSTNKEFTSILQLILIYYHLHLELNVIWFMHFNLNRIVKENNNLFRVFVKKVIWNLILYWLLRKLNTQSVYEIILAHICKQILLCKQPKINQNLFAWDQSNYFGWFDATRHWI